jgi:Tfp pilus assembly protein PilV
VFSKKNPFTLIRDSDENGVSLVEVIVAIALIMIVATSSATLSIQAIASSASQERRQIAVTVANSALELVAAQPVQVDSTGVSALYNGRFSTTVGNAFTATVSYNGVAKTYRAADPTATSVTIPDIPITTTAVQSGTTFTVRTLIGPCYQATSGGDCGLVSGYANTGNGPATAPSGFSQLIRAIVVVTWTAGGTCTASSCAYTATTLIDPHADLAWVSHG